MADTLAEAGAQSTAAAQNASTASAKTRPTSIPGGAAVPTGQNLRSVAAGAAEAAQAMAAAAALAAVARRRRRARSIASHAGV